jgi:hypothetical protein
MTRTPKEIRQAARLSLIAAAVGAGTSETTARVYEANPTAVSASTRAKLDAFYRDLEVRQAAPA